MKNKCFKILYILFVIFIILINYYSVFADISEIYQPIETGNKLFNAANIIVGTIKWVGVAILIGAIMLKGIKYVTSSPEGKADIKKDIVMLTVGTILLFSFMTLIDVIYDLVEQSGLK